MIFHYNYLSERDKDYDANLIVSLQLDGILIVSNPRVVPAGSK